MTHNDQICQFSATPSPAKGALSEETLAQLLQHPAISRRPEFIRLPKAGTLCPRSGLSRTGLNLLILPCAANNFRPPVRSVSLRKPGQLRGTRLIVFDSLMTYLHGLEEPAPSTAVIPPTEISNLTGGTNSDQQPVNKSIRSAAVGDEIGG